MGASYCFRKEDHVVIVMPYMEHQAIVVYIFVSSIFRLLFSDILILQSVIYLPNFNQVLFVLVLVL